MRYTRQGSVTPLALLLLVATWLLAGCVSVDVYQPEPTDTFLVDDAYSRQQGEDADASIAKVMRLDGISVNPARSHSRVRLAGAAPGGGDLYALKTFAGEHRLTVQVCESGFYAHCGEAYLLIEMESGRTYSVMSRLSKSRGYLEVWIVDLHTQETVVKPFRVMGLTKRAS